MINKKMKKMLQEAQRMQDQLQSDLSEMRVSATSGGGVVTATVTVSYTHLTLPKICSV